jgi:hypothetical protein
VASVTADRFIILLSSVTTEVVDDRGTPDAQRLDHRTVTFPVEVVADGAGANLPRRFAAAPTGAAPGAY